MNHRIFERILHSLVFRRVCLFENRFVLSLCDLRVMCKSCLSGYGLFPWCSAMVGLKLMIGASVWDKALIESLGWLRGEGSVISFWRDNWISFSAISGCFGLTIGMMFVVLIQDMDNRGEFSNGRPFFKSIDGLGFRMLVPFFRSGSVSFSLAGHGLYLSLMAHTTQLCQATF